MALGSTEALEEVVVAPADDIDDRIADRDHIDIASAAMVVSPRPKNFGAL